MQTYHVSITPTSVFGDPGIGWTKGPQTYEVLASNPGVAVNRAMRALRAGHYFLRNMRWDFKVAVVVLEDYSRRKEGAPNLKQTVAVV